MAERDRDRKSRDLKGLGGNDSKVKVVAQGRKVRIEKKREGRGEKRKMEESRLVERQDLGRNDRKVKGW